jgi:hypothetical protein
MFTDFSKLPHGGLAQYKALTYTKQHNTEKCGHITVPRAKLKKQTRDF